METFGGAREVGGMMCKCVKCGYEWMPRKLKYERISRKFKPQTPKKCPQCQYENWENGINKKTGRKPNTLEKFYQRIEKTKGCWGWKGTVRKDGRGVFKLDGKCQTAYRVSYKVFVGEIPLGMEVCHKCDNGACINPDHLFIGTQKDNIDDCLSKKRNAFGYKNWNTKLDEEKVNLIRNTDFSEHGSKAKMSRLLGISQTALNYVLSRKNWSHV